MNIDDPETRAAVELLIARLHPGLAKSRPTELTDEELDIRGSKIAFKALLDEFGLSNRDAAELLGRSPSTVDGWVRIKSLDRAVPDHVFNTLRRRATVRKVAV